MKILHLGIFLFACFSTHAQRILVPQDLLESILRDSCVVVGEIDQDLEITLSYQGSVFYASTGASGKQLVVQSIQDSLFGDVESVRHFWQERHTLPQGEFCLQVLKKGKVLAARCQQMEKQQASIDLVYGLDSFTLSSELLKDERLNYSIHAFSMNTSPIEGQLRENRSHSFAYADFQRNTPFTIKYATAHESGIVLSDTNSKRFVPNRSIRHDSIKKAIKTRSVLLKQEIKTLHAHPFDSLRSPKLPAGLTTAPKGTFSLRYGAFQGNNNSLPNNNFMDLQAQSHISVLGMPIVAQMYFFDNGIDFYDRRDLKFSFDYQGLLSDLEAKKEQIAVLKPDTSALSRLYKERLLNHLPDTAQLLAAIRSKKDSLSNTKQLEGRLLDSLNSLKKLAVDSLPKDSLDAVYGKYEAQKNLIQDSIARIEQQVDQLEQSLAKAKALKRQYEDAYRTDSILISQRESLQSRASDSLSQYMDIDKYLAEKDFLSKHEEAYRKARDLYEKLKKIKKLDLGTITPYESPYSLSGVPLKGFSTQYDIKEQSAGITIGKMLSTPFFFQNTYNVVALSDEFALLDLGDMKTSSTSFWQGNMFQSISEISVRSNSWKGWKTDFRLANSINQNYFSNTSEAYPVVNAGNTVIQSSLTKTLKSGLHSIETQYKYIPASYFTPGNPFLINDIRAGTVRLNNSLLKQRLTSFIELEVNHNNTLNQLPETAFRKSLFSFQQLAISESFQLTALNSVLISNGPVEQRFKMHDINLQFNQDMWGGLLNTSVGLMYQEFSTQGELLNQSLLVKGNIALMKQVNRIALSYYQSIPTDGAVSFTTTQISVRKNLLKELWNFEIRGGTNTVAHMHPKLSYGIASTIQIYKGIKLTLDYQANAVLIDKSRLHSNNSIGFVRVFSSF